MATLSQKVFSVTTALTFNARHALGRYVTVAVYDSNGILMTPNVAYTAQHDDMNNMLVTFNDPTTCKIVIS